MTLSCMPSPCIHQCQDAAHLAQGDAPPVATAAQHLTNGCGPGLGSLGGHSSTAGSSRDVGRVLEFVLLQLLYEFSCRVLMTRCVFLCACCASRHVALHWHRCALPSTAPRPRLGPLTCVPASSLDFASCWYTTSRATLPVPISTSCRDKRGVGWGR